MILEIINCHQRVFKLAIMAELSRAFNVLEHWQEDSEDAASPETLKTNNVEWIKGSSS